MGQDMEIASDITLDRHHVDVVSTLHIWDRSPGLTGVKAIADAIRSAFTEPLVINGRRVPLWFSSSRYLRDKDGISAHAVITFECRMELA